MTKIESHAMSIGYGKRKVLNNLSLKIPESKITCIIGPNGCGKSTLLKTIARLLKPANGSVTLDGKSIHKQATKVIAQEIAILTQAPQTPEDITVKELVSYGRAPYQKGFGQLQTKDWEKIHWALDQAQLLNQADRSVSSLSGGQKQRVWIAMALAQDTDCLLLDEPTTYLDMAHQLEVLQVLETLNKKYKRTIVMVLHDLNHAARFADHLIAIREGEVMKSGTPEEVMQPDILRAVFDIEASIVEDPHTGKPALLSYQLIE
ncbi:iron complex transport system ATP-binding protein [Marinilactibacillus piezotolerans]|uniref:Iron complex transport system ATP-binding protein n=1 Tax=Marinilactibacillus piezotolerans TaxID=258723 RepID=A0A1I4AK61_9LACT|nr:ABC transporter ATP-binding protein [Marinilactibacillus piezotolerans]SFK56570.1 iron complex transport system ATP-binding protein [Marinilactibacillus piezotolerans]